MPASKNSARLPKIFIITLPLILLQGYILFRYKEQTQVLSFKDAMNQAISVSNKIAPEQQPLAKLHLAINNYRIKKGNFPKNLVDLVPEYFNEIPRDPATAKVYVYRLTQKGISYDLGLNLKSSKDQDQSVKKDVDSDKELIDSLSHVDQEVFLYDPVGKKDPFLAFDFSKSVKEPKPGQSQLERFDYQELRVAAILLDSDVPTAIIEDTSGRGHTVKIGAPIGLYGGTVNQIEKDKVVVKETTIDFTGEEVVKFIDLFLPKDDKQFEGLLHFATPSP